jgi:hypothetical protein
VRPTQTSTWDTNTEDQMVDVSQLGALLPVIPAGTYAGYAEVGTKITAYRAIPTSTWFTSEAYTPSVCVSQPVSVYLAHANGLRVQALRGSDSILQIYSDDLFTDMEGPKPSTDPRMWHLPGTFCR